jgi:hypothetical protein
MRKPHLVLDAGTRPPVLVPGGRRKILRFRWRTGLYKRSRVRHWKRSSTRWVDMVLFVLGDLQRTRRQGYFRGMICLER